MTEPRRLIEEGATEFETGLLQSGRGDAMSEQSRQRICGAVTLGASAAAGAGAGPAFGPDATPRSWGASGARLKLLAVLGVGAASGMVVWAALHSAGMRTPQVRPPTAVHAAPNLQAPEPVQTPAATTDDRAHAPVTDAARRATAPAPRTPARDRDDQLAAETAALDGAGRMLAAGDASGALSALAAYRRAFPHGRLASEATVLRIEALHARGDREQAERLGRGFLARHPHAPFATRVRSLIEADPAAAQLGPRAP